MMVASNQPIGFLAFEAVLYGWKSMPQRAKVHNSCVTAMLKFLERGLHAAGSAQNEGLSAKSSRLKP